jgi:hypothetical protein
MSDQPKADPTPAPTAAPRRSFFKKSSWQTAVKTEGAKQDIFSHSSDYGNIVAEKARRQQERRQKEEEENKRASERANMQAEMEAEARREVNRRNSAAAKREKAYIENYDRKRQKVSAELGGSPNSAARGPGGAIKEEDKKNIDTSLSPGVKCRPSNTLRSSYATRPGSAVTPSKKQTQIVVLDDPSSDSDKAPLPKKPKAPRESDSDDDDPHDPELEALIAKVRARRLNQQTSPLGSGTGTELTPGISSGTPASAEEPAKQPIVQLFIESELPDTKPLLIKIRISDTLKKPRLAWCGRHNFPAAYADNIFLTWRGERVWDSTSIARLGVSVDARGYISVKGDDNLYMDDEPPKIHLQAWTQELYDEVKREEEAAAAEVARLKVAASMTQYERDALAELPVVEKKISLVLKTKGLEDFKIKVKPSTSFEHLASAYRTARNIPSNTAISLFFDGDRLKPMDIVADSEIEEMDALEVHFN